MNTLFGVVGDPVSHSLSPLIHNGWMKTHGFQAVYEKLPIPTDAFQEGMRDLEGRGAIGLNVTLPHKSAAAEYASHVSQTVKRLGAANTLHRVAGVWHAENTDVGGFQDLLAGTLKAPLAGRRAFVLGAGGSARAIVYALSQAGAAITLCNRTVSRADALVSDIGVQTAGVCDLETGLANLSNADLVVNTTSAGHEGKVFDLPAGDDRLFCDISYGAAANALMSAAQAQGWRTTDGLSMLVHQAARSFEIWFGVRPDADAALKACRRSLAGVA